MFTFEPGVAFWTIVSFLVVLFFIQKVVYPPIRKVLDERRNNIEYALVEAQKDKVNANEMLATAETKLRDVKNEAHKIISAAKEKAYSLEQEYTGKAEDKYRELLKQKEKELQVIEENFYKAMEDHIAQLVIKACHNILRFDLSKEQQEKVVADRIQELEKLDKF